MRATCCVVPSVAPLAFAGFRFPPEVITLAVRWYLRFGLSYRDLEELLAERGIDVDHVSIFRWVQRFTPLLAHAAHPCRHRVGDRWWMDEGSVALIEDELGRVGRCAVVRFRCHPGLLLQGFGFRQGQANRRDLSDADDRFFLRIEVAHACRSSDDTSRRLRDALEDRAREGRPHSSGQRAYGYARDAVTVIEHEAVIVREVYARCLAPTLQCRAVGAATRQHNRPPGRSPRIRTINVPLRPPRLRNDPVDGDGLHLLEQAHPDRPAFYAIRVPRCRGTPRASFPPRLTTTQLPPARS
jgi:hypothetical protein